MRITINKDFVSEYKDDFWKGFSIRELFFVVIGGACAIGAIVGIHFAFKVELSTAIYFGIPFMIPAVFIGFYNYQGYLKAIELLKELLCQKNLEKLYFESSEEAVGSVFTMKSVNEEKRKGE